MKVRNRKAMLLASVILVAGAAIAATVSIDARTAPYNAVPVAQGVTISDPVEIRTAGLFGLTGAYRTTHGSLSLPPNSTVKVTWHDGGREEAKVLCLAGTACVQPVPGTQQNPGGGGGGGGPPGGGGSGGGYDWSMCFTSPGGTGCVDVGAGPKCETFPSELVCPMG